MNMKKISLTLLLIIYFLVTAKAEDFNTTFTYLSETSSRVEFKLDNFYLQQINLGGTDYTRIDFAGRVTTMDEGFAELPFVNVNISLSPLKNLSYKIVSTKYTDYLLDFPLVPSRGVIYRNQDPSTIPYRIASESLIDDYYPAQLIEMMDPYIIKDVRGTTLYFYPFRYNAVQRILRVYTEIIVQLDEDDTDPVNPLLNPSGRYFTEMEELYRSVFINYESPVDYPNIGETGDILVITTTRDETAIQPYINWKKEKGYNVWKEVVTAGTNVKNLIKQKYNANPAILFVQLVGDWADIKCDIGGEENAPMDPMLGCVVGTDNFPDIAIGRFSANSDAHVTIQVNKSINYEKNPSGVWYDKAISVASNEGAGIGDDGEIDYQHTNIIYNYKLNPFTYNTHYTVYEPSGTATMVKNAIENGASIINYCGHGSKTSWGTTGFNNNNVNQLTNGNKLPFIFSVACLNGAFHSGDCFAEAWLRKNNGGAVWTIMSTVNQPWQPPMRGQDYFNDILTGGYNYNTNPGNGINTTEGRTILGSIALNGLVLMYTESSNSSDLKTLQTWTTFGDVALQARTMTPKTLTLTNTNLQAGLPFETIVKANGAPIKNALVALSQNGTYVKAYTTQNGAVSIPNNFIPGDVLLVVTAFNCNTIYQTIQSAPAAGPAVYLDEVTINDTYGNNNGQLDYGETVGLNVSLKNSGLELAKNVNAILSCNDDYITILNGNTFFGNIGIENTVTVSNAFTIKAAPETPDNHEVLFSIIATSEGSSWESFFSLIAYSAVLNYDSHTISDPTGNNNGKLDPGETATFFIVVKNFGNSDASNVIGTLTSSSPYITISQGQANYGNIAAGEENQKTFTVSAAASTPAGQMVTFNFDITADLGITGTGQFTVVVGQIPVLIIDMDKNHNSAPKIVDALNQIGISHELVTTFPNNLSLYSSIFVCLGVYSNNHILTAQQGSLLAAYLNDGGRLYMEGGDTWYYNSPTAVHAMFGILGQFDGSGDLSTIVGMAGTFTEGMSFPYNGDNNYIDRIAPTGGATLILQNNSPVYGTAVAYDAGTYKTIGASHEFGGLTDGASTKAELMEKYLDFFMLLPPSLLEQNILIPTGWSGISSFLIPENNQIEVVLQPIINNLIILESQDGIYYPGQNINTIGVWNYDQGYKIKMESAAQLTINGWEPPNLQLNLKKGWNIIPVLSNCNVSADELFNSIDELQIITEIAGNKVYWPEMEIWTLESLKTGKAYMVKVTNPISITFPECYRQ